MSLLRKSLWTALTLSATALVGCQPEEPTPASPGQTPSPVVAPKADSSQGEMKPLMKPMPEAKPAPEGEMKPDAEKAEPEVKVEGPKLDAPAPVPAPAKPDEKADKKDDQAAAVKLEPEEISEIEKLSADDQKLALKQLVCPVSDEHLGAMGTPLKVEAEGKTFFICCKGCQKEVNKDAKAVVAKLKD